MLLCSLPLELSEKFCDYGHSIENSGAKMTYREQNKFKEIVLFS